MNIGMGKVRGVQDVKGRENGLEWVVSIYLFQSARVHSVNKRKYKTQPFVITE